MGTEPSAIRQEITRPHLGKEVALRRSADRADLMGSTMEGPEPSSAQERGINWFVRPGVRTLRVYLFRKNRGIFHPRDAGEQMGRYCI